jgi:parallel beta-helix repeat protein
MEARVMKKHTIIFLFALPILFCFSPLHVLAQGSMEPPPEARDETGAPKASMKTLNQVEPRTLILSVPFTITNSGSYYLAGNLVYTNTVATNGITIAADDVRVDLDGFTLTAASGSISLDGISVAYRNADPWQYFNITIRNGVIRGWGSDGIDAREADDSQIFDMKIMNNGAYGMVIGPNSLVERCSIRQSGSCGLEIQDGGTVLDCKVYNSGSVGPFYEGIYASGSKISGCSANHNKYGIWVNQYCTVRDCTVLWNDNHGISVGDSCRIEDNNCSQNAYNNSTGAGIYIRGSGNRVEANNVTFNQQGILVDSFNGGKLNLIVRNSACNNTVMPFQTSGSDFYGTVMNTNTMGTAGFTGDPWSNFSF